ncbi:MAG: radical SAM protein [Planctomycetota bacterium]
METAEFALPTSEIHVWVVYLTARCNFNCSYCIQKEVMTPDRPRKPWLRYRELSGREWVEALNALPVRPAHTLILTGGEPSIHPGFLEICAGLDGYRLEMTSNLTFDVDELAAVMKRAGKRFEAAFHTYHPKWMRPEEFVLRAEKLRDSGIVVDPVFSMVDLDAFPHFRDDEFDEQQQRFFEVARARGLLTQRNEFRGHHMGSPFDRSARRTIECTSSWVNFAPNGDVHNCQYHLESGKHAFGNVTDPAGLRRMPRMGEWFACGDFGFCDPCHENSGHGAFRDEEGRIFRRDAHDSRVYLQWMAPESIKAVARRFERQGDHAEAAAAWLAAIGREQRDGEATDPASWADLGISLWQGGHKRKALAAIMHALELGHRDMDALVAAVQLGRETDLLDGLRPELTRYLAADELARIERAAAETFV